MAWMLSGETSATKSGFTVGAAGKINCKTSLKSSCKVVDALGLEVRGKKNLAKAGDDGGPQMYTWADTPRGIKMVWEAQTISDSKPYSDRLNVTLQMFDADYVSRLANQIVDELTEAQMEQIANGDVSVVEKKVEEKLNLDLVYKEMYSDTLYTDSDGKASGEIQFKDDWPATNYNLLIHYGYDAESEKGDTEKAYEFWVEEWGVTIVEMTLIIVGIFVPPVGVVAIAIGGPALAYEMGRMGYLYFKNGLGSIGVNKEGCSFPIGGGFTHTYTINYELEEMKDDMNANISITTRNKLENISSFMTTGNVYLKIAVLGAIFGMILYFLRPSEVSENG